MSATLHEFLQRMPLIAILRGLDPREAPAIGAALHSAGLRIFEVPLNSPQPLQSIRILADLYGHDCLIGAGTVMSAHQVEQVASVGGRLIVMPHGDASVIAAAKRLGLFCAPGVATPSEGFAALACGADALKLFPAEQLTPAVLKAWRAVFPAETAFIPVGGLVPESLGAYARVGATGFGLGSALYAPGRSAQDVAARAAAFVAAIRALPN